ncbi:MAG: DUF29 domain-containing protein [Acetobacteraceae bacterium]
MGGSKYETDFYGWANEQAGLLRTRRLNEAELDNIAEEIESMGRGEKRELVNRLAVLLAHLLKWQFQPGLRSTSWRLTIIEQRKRLARHLIDNPSLKPSLPEALADAYDLARLTAQRETGLLDNTFPPTCPFSFEQAADEQFWPD